MDVISKFHGTETTKIKQKNKDEIIALILRPQAVNDYNIRMGGVDKADLLCSLNGASGKSKNGSTTFYLVKHQNLEGHQYNTTN